MAKVRFIKKTPAGGMGNSLYEYACSCSAGASHTVKVTCANDNEAKLLAQLECDDTCGETKLRADGIREFDHPIFEGGPVPESATTEFWSRAQFVYWDGDKLWGYWNYNRDLACGANMPGFFSRSEIASYDLTAGACPPGVPTAGQPLVKVVRNW